MSALTFTLKSAPVQRLDCAPLTPDALVEKSLADIAAIELVTGNTTVRVGDVFDVAGDDTSNIVMNHCTEKCDFIGKAMTQGSITVNGDVGAYLGQFMEAGDITVNGNSYLYTACEMKGGQIKVNGNVGDFLGGARAGYKNGMTGGTVIVTGNAGDRVGDHMRRGYLLIEGSVGAYCCSRMVSGTVAVLGEVGEHLGYGMKRGTLLLQKMPTQGIPVNFNDCGSHTLAFLPLMLTSFKKLDSKFALLETYSRVQRYAGDIGGIGMGEILVRL